MHSKVFFWISGIWVSEELFDFLSLWWNSFWCLVCHKKSTCLTPKWHFAIRTLRPAFLIHLKTVLMLMQSWVESFAAIPMSSLFCAHWPVLIALSRYPLIKDEKADKKRLRPWTRRRYANVGSHSWKPASGSPAFANNGMPGSNRGCKRASSRPYAVLHPITC